MLTTKYNQRLFCGIRKSLSFIFSSWYHGCSWLISRLTAMYPRWTAFITDPTLHCNLEHSRPVDLVPSSEFLHHINDWTVYIGVFSPVSLFKVVSANRNFINFAAEHWFRRRDAIRKLTSLCGSVCLIKV